MPSTTLFELALAARQSPQNGCFAQEGELLAVAAVPRWPTTVRSHFFTGTQSGRESKYGWVYRLSKPMTISDFMAGFECKGFGQAFEDIQLNMFEAVARLKVGDAVAADFVTRGVEQKAVHLHVHKVIFHGV